MSVGGQRIAGPYVGVLEGIQGHQDFIRILMNPSRLLFGSNMFFQTGGILLYENCPPRLEHFLNISLGKTFSFQNNRGFFSRQSCCYYCRAVQWVYVDENEELSNHLYTSFGPDAHHRQTFQDCFKLSGCLF